MRRIVMERNGSLRTYLSRKLESAHLVFQPLLLEAHNMLPHHDEI